MWKPTPELPLPRVLRAKWQGIKPSLDLKIQDTCSSGLQECSVWPQGPERKRRQRRGKEAQSQTPCSPPRAWRGPRRAGCSSAPGLRSRPDPSQGPTGQPPSPSSWGLHGDKGGGGRSLCRSEQTERRCVQEGGSSQDVPGVRGSRGRRCPAWSPCWVRFQLSAGGCSLSRRYRRAWTPPQGCWGVGRVSWLTERAGRQALASVPGPGGPWTRPDGGHPQAEAGAPRSPPGPAPSSPVRVRVWTICFRSSPAPATAALGLFSALSSLFVGFLFFFRKETSLKPRPPVNRGVAFKCVEFNFGSKQPTAGSWCAQGSEE